MAKKKFRDTGVGKVLLGALGILSPPLADVVRGASNVTEALDAIKGSQLPPEDKIKLNELIAEHQIEEQKEITKRWESDAMGDSGLSKNVRPAILVCCFIFMVGFTVVDSFDIGFNVAEPWINFWTVTSATVFGAYFGGRSLEKSRVLK